MNAVGSRSGLTISIICGALLPLAFAPFGYWLLAPLCLAGLFLALEGAGPGRAFRNALAFGLPGFLAGIYWIFISVSIFYGAPAALGIAATIGLVVALSLFFAVAIALAARLVRLEGTLGVLIVMPAVWVLAEWCRNWMFSGFGWLSTGYSQTDTWLMGYAPVAGLHGVSLAVAFTAAAVTFLLRHPSRLPPVYLASIALLWGTGWLLEGVRWTQARPTFVRVAIAQAAVPQDQKWRPEQYLPTLEKYRSLSLMAAGSDIIVWPEVAVPNLFSSARGFLETLQAELDARGSTLVTGILRNHADGNERNAVVAMTAEPQFYIKRHLVPFGEYFPLPEFVLRWLRSMRIPFPDIGAGAQEQPLLHVAGEAIAVSICYEDVFGAEQRSFFPEASLIVNVANDAWFGESIAAEQHLQIARMRAAEVGRYVLRSTNTGVSAIIDPLGNLMHIGPKFEAAVLTETIQGFTGATPWVRWGNYPVVILAFGMLAAAAIKERRRD